jgi:hypothetical protein
VKVLRNVGGLFLAAVAIVAVWSGLTGQGREFSGSFLAMVRSFWAWVRGSVNGLDPGALTRGLNAAQLGGILVGLVVFAAGVIFVPAVRQGRGMVVLGIAAALLGFAVYSGGLS